MLITSNCCEIAISEADPSYMKPQNRAGIWASPSETFTNRDVCDEPTWMYSRRVSGGGARVAATTDGAYPLESQISVLTTTATAHHAATVCP